MAFTFDSVADNQNNKETTFNNWLDSLDALMGSTVTISVTDTNAYIIPTGIYMGYGVFTVDEAAGSPTANNTITLTVPNIARPRFVVINATAFDVILKTTGQTPLRQIEAGKSGHYYTVEVAGNIEVWTGHGVPIPGITPLEAWSWGANSDGRLGLGDTTNRSSPVQIGALVNWQNVSITWYHAAAVKNDGTLWAWGLNDYGQLGDGTTTDKSSPVQVGALTDWAQVSCGQYHTLALKTDGTIWAWGRATDGRLGNGATLPHISSPVQIGALTTWAFISAGKSQSYGIKTDGTLWAWGDNLSGTLGDATTTDRSSPVQIGALADWAYIHGGNLFTVAVKTDGTLWTWGSALSGRLGNGTTTPNLSSPVQVGALTDWLMVACNESHTLAVKTDGTLWGWGDNSNGLLGDGTTTGRSSPVQIGALTDWLQVATGPYHSGAVKTDGTLWTWGQGTSGALGNGSTVNKSSPTQVGALTTWNQLAIGHYCGIALKEPS